MISQAFSSTSSSSLSSTTPLLSSSSTTSSSLSLNCLLIDFGQSIATHTSNGSIHHSTSFKGKSYYASLARHKGLPQGRSDDIVMFLFVCLDFLLGHLPWLDHHNLRANDREAARAGMQQMKELFISQEINQILTSDKQIPSPSVQPLHTLLQQLSALTPSDDPPYDHIALTLDEMYELELAEEDKKRSMGEDLSQYLSLEECVQLCSNKGEMHRKNICSQIITLTSPDERVDQYENIEKKNILMPSELHLQQNLSEEKEIKVENEAKESDLNHSTIPVKVEDVRSKSMPLVSIRQLPSISQTIQSPPPLKKAISSRNPISHLSSSSPSISMSSSSSTSSDVRMCLSQFGLISFPRYQYLLEEIFSHDDVHSDELTWPVCIKQIRYIKEKERWYIIPYTNINLSTLSSSSSSSSSLTTATSVFDLDSNSQPLRLDSTTILFMDFIKELNEWRANDDQSKPTSTELFIQLLDIYSHENNLLWQQRAQKLFVRPKEPIQSQNEESNSRKVEEETEIEYEESNNNILQQSKPLLISSIQPSATSTNTKYNSAINLTTSSYRNVSSTTIMTSKTITPTPTASTGATINLTGSVRIPKKFTPATTSSILPPANKLQPKPAEVNLSAIKSNLAKTPNNSSLNGQTIVSRVSSPTHGTSEEQKSTISSSQSADSIVEKLKERIAKKQTKIISSDNSKSSSKDITSQSLVGQSKVKINKVKETEKEIELPSSEEVVEEVGEQELEILIRTKSKKKKKSNLVRDGDEIDEIDIKQLSKSAEKQIDEERVKHSMSSGKKNVNSKRQSFGRREVPNSKSETSSSSNHLADEESDLDTYPSGDEEHPQLSASDYKSAPYSVDSIIRSRSAAYPDDLNHFKARIIDIDHLSSLLKSSKEQVIQEIKEGKNDLTLDDATVGGCDITLKEFEYGVTIIPEKWKWAYLIEWVDYPDFNPEWIVSDFIKGNKEKLASNMTNTKTLAPNSEEEKKKLLRKSSSKDKKLSKENHHNLEIYTKEEMSMTSTSTTKEEMKVSDTLTTQNEQALAEIKNGFDQKYSAEQKPFANIKSSTIKKVNDAVKNNDIDAAEKNKKADLVQESPPSNRSSIKSEVLKERTVTAGVSASTEATLKKKPGRNSTNSPTKRTDDQQPPESPPTTNNVVSSATFDQTPDSQTSKKRGRKRKEEVLQGKDQQTDEKKLKKKNETPPSNKESSDTVILATTNNATSSSSLTINAEESSSLLPPKSKGKKVNSGVKKGYAYVEVPNDPPSDDKLINIINSIESHSRGKRTRSTTMSISSTPLTSEIINPSINHSNLNNQINQVNKSNAEQIHHDDTNTGSSLSTAANSNNESVVPSATKRGRKRPKVLIDTSTELPSTLSSSSSSSTSSDQKLSDPLHLSSGTRIKETDWRPTRSRAKSISSPPLETDHQSSPLAPTTTPLDLSASPKRKFTKKKSVK